MAMTALFQAAQQQTQKEESRYNTQAILNNYWQQSAFDFDP
jgi:hypothetical protein